VSTTVRQSRPKRRKLLPEDYLQRAMQAKTPNARGNWARKGLAFPGDLDPTTQVMLLRQLYLSHFAASRFGEACEAAEQAAELGVLTDVLHHDAARAKHALGDVDGAVQHLRLAARLGPPRRRAFHWWTVGSVLFLARRHDEAIDALRRAARWGTTDKPLYQGHLALAKCHAGQPVRGLRDVIDRLAACSAGRGYGRFVLGQLAYETSRYKDARRYLQAFIKRTDSSQLPMQIALRGELEMARDTLMALEAS
jgi:tetratricopeptide (TPR) repeat protein